MCYPLQANAHSVYLGVVIVICCVTINGKPNNVLSFRVLSTI